MLMNLSPSRLAAVIVATESSGISFRNSRRTERSNSTTRLGSLDPESRMSSTYPIRIPLSRTGDLVAVPDASSMKVCSIALRWNTPPVPVSRKIRIARIAMATSARIPTFSCDQRTFWRSGIRLFPCFHELGDVGIAARLQLALAALESQASLLHHHKRRMHVMVPAGHERL